MYGLITGFAVKASLENWLCIKVKCIKVITTFCPLVAGCRIAHKVMKVMKVGLENNLCNNEIFFLHIKLP